MIESSSFSDRSIVSDRSIWSAATQQRIFRQLMNAFSYPGRIYDLHELQQESCDEDLLIGILATLLDSTTSLSDPTGMLQADDWSRLQAVHAEAENAEIIVYPGAAPVDIQPCLGTLENPDQGATLILRVSSLGKGRNLDISGPGVVGKISLFSEGLNPSWLSMHKQWNAQFPLGVDYLLLDQSKIAALPRTTRIHRGTS